MEDDFPIVPISIRDLLRLDPDPGSNQQFRLHGIVLDKNTQKENVYLNITDGIEQIQVVVLRTDLQAFGINGPEGISLLDRVDFTGKYGVYGKQNLRSIFPTSFKITINNRDFKFDRFDFDKNVNPMLQLAFINSSLAELLFLENDFTEIECRQISTSPAPADLNPLRVLFSGRGCPVYLEVSPLPQMIYSCLMGGISRLFTRTRLFTRAHRDGFTSAESQILAGVSCSKVGDKNPDEALFEKLVQATVNWLHTQTKLPIYQKVDTLAIEEWPDERQNENPPVALPTIVMRTVPDGNVIGQYAYSVSKVLELLVPEGFAIIEGQVGRIGSVVQYMSITIHVERIKRLLGGYEQWRVRRVAKIPLSQQHI